MFLIETIFMNSTLSQKSLYVSTCDLGSVILSSSTLMRIVFVILSQVTGLDSIISLLPLPFFLILSLSDL